MKLFAACLLLCAYVIPLHGKAQDENASVKSYQNYDFVPGDKIIFADDFSDDRDGEFPAHWELVNGQGAVNKTDGYEAFALSDGNNAKVKPRVKAASYLTNEFTVEFDTYFPEGGYPFTVFLYAAGSSDDEDAHIGINETTAEYYANADNYTLSANLPDALNNDNYIRKWHHIALAYKDKQLKVYVDQYRVLTVPDTHIIPAKLQLGGLATQQAPVVFRNVKIASGGGMNMIGKKFTDAKIVTHGINFDVDKATIRPESMGTLNQIKQLMADNPDVKFEIDGHTDNSGTSAHNLTLSQQRADAVKTRLVEMGVSGLRLTTKGLGDTKPLSDNTTPEGKANNRRVEFVKQ